MNFDSLFVNPNGHTPRSQFVPALITLLVAVGFYAYFVNNRTGQFCMLVLLYPAIILHARRLHDMGRTAWLLIVPGVLMVATFAIWLHYTTLGAQLDVVVPWIAIAVFAVFALWGCVGKGRAATQR